MARRRVMVEMKWTPALESAATASPTAAPAAFAAGLTLGVVSLDATYAPVVLPHPSVPPGVTMEAAFGARAVETTTMIVRGDVDDAEIGQIANLVDGQQVVGVFADPFVAPFVTCAATGPVGTAATVAAGLCVPSLQARGLDGANVLVAIVDTGFNRAYLQAHGQAANFDASLSWAANATVTPGAAAVNHGTMCAFDVQIAAPACTLIDIALLLPNAAPGPVISGVLSDAVRAYSYLLTTVMPRITAGDFRALVVNNSWGMFHPSWDFPVGNPGNYSDNPNHPFNRIVASLERAGADILFAAGNCGAPCPDGRCQGLTTGGIYGANSHSQVLCVAGVDTTGARVGYSSPGPGRLMANKPDVATFTHFAGSGVYAADGGTSAATTVCTGVVAALRTGLPFNATNPASSPAQMRALLIAQAVRQPGGFNFDYGWGTIDGCALAAQVPAVPVVTTSAAAAPAAVVAVAVSAHQPLGPSPVETV